MGVSGGGYGRKSPPRGLGEREGKGKGRGGRRRGSSRRWGAGPRAALQYIGRPPPCPPPGACGARPGPAEPSDGKGGGGRARDLSPTGKPPRPLAGAVFGSEAPGGNPLPSGLRHPPGRSLGFPELGGKLNGAPVARPRASFIPRPAASSRAGKAAPQPPRCPDFVEFFPGKSAPRRPGRSDGESRGCSAPNPPVSHCAASWVREPSFYFVFYFVSPWESGKGCAELGAARRYEGCGAGMAFGRQTGERGGSPSPRLKVALRKPCWVADGGRSLLSCE